MGQKKKKKKINGCWAHDDDNDDDYDDCEMIKYVLPKTDIGIQTNHKLYVYFPFRLFFGNCWEKGFWLVKLGAQEIWWNIIQMSWRSSTHTFKISILILNHKPTYVYGHTIYIHAYIYSQKPMLNDKIIMLGAIESWRKKCKEIFPFFTNICRWSTVLLKISWWNWNILGLE